MVRHAGAPVRRGSPPLRLGVFVAPGEVEVVLHVAFRVVRVPQVLALPEETGYGGVRGELLAVRIRVPAVHGVVAVAPDGARRRGGVPQLRPQLGEDPRLLQRDQARRQILLDALVQVPLHGISQRVDVVLEPLRLVLERVVIVPQDGVQEETRLGMVAHLSVHRRSVRLVRVDQPCVQVPRVDLVNLRLDLLRYLREYLPFPLGVDLFDLLIVRHLASVHLLVGVRHQPAAVDALHDRPEHLLEPLVRLVLLLHLLSKHLAFELLAYEVLALVVLLPDHLAEFVPRQGLAVRVDLALGARVGILRGSARFVVVVVVVFVFVVFVVRRVLVFGRLAADAAESVAPLRGRRLGRGEHRGLVRGIGDTARASDRAERGIFFFVFFFVIVVVVVASIERHGGSVRIVEAIVERLHRWKGWEGGRSAHNSLKAGFRGPIMDSRG